MNLKMSIGIRLAVLLIAAATVWLLCSPMAQAVSPAPDGGYAGNNTAEGTSALFSLTSGIDNTALGFQALYHNTTGRYNNGVGYLALFHNTTGTQNTAAGVNALITNTTGSYNTANGSNALYYNTNSYNTADGYAALFRNTSGFDNTAIGDEALFNNTAGVSNTAIGGEALLNNAEGSNNVAVGRNALRYNTAGQGNTASGGTALENNTQGSNNTALGNFAGSSLTTGDNNIDVGYNVTGVAGESNTIRIGNTDITDTYIRGISGVTISGGAAAYVNSNGKLGTITSSARFKDKIQPMGKASEAILALRPVSFRYKKKIDPQGIPQFGLVAEEVEKVNPDLIIRDPEGKPQTVRYEQINAMLLNEFLKEHDKVERLENDFQTTIAQQQKEIRALTAQLKEQAAQIQKVNARVQVSTPAPQMVANHP